MNERLFEHYIPHIICGCQCSTDIADYLSKQIISIMKTPQTSQSVRQYCQIHLRKSQLSRLETQVRAHLASINENPDSRMKHNSRQGTYITPIDDNMRVFYKTGINAHEFILTKIQIVSK